MLEKELTMRSTTLETQNAIQPGTGRADSAPAADHISYSALAAYRDCPLLYRFRYVDKLPELTVSAALLFGGAIHAALEHYFREKLTGRSTGLDKLMHCYRLCWQAEADDRELLFAKGEDPDSLHALAERMLAAFLASPAAKPQGQIVGVEEELRTELAPGLPPLLARIDLLLDTGDALRIVDFKTARTRWSEQKAQEAAEQLWLYAKAARELLPGRELQLEFLILTKAKQPAVQSLPVPFDEPNLHRVRQTAAAVWQAISARIFYPAPSPLRCPTCPFANPCRRWPAAVHPAS